MKKIMLISVLLMAPFMCLQAHEYLIWADMSPQETSNSTAEHDVWYYLAPCQSVVQGRDQYIKEIKQIADASDLFVTVSSVDTGKCSTAFDEKLNSMFMKLAISSRNGKEVRIFKNADGSFILKILSKR